MYKNYQKFCKRSETASRSLCNSKTRGCEVLHGINTAQRGKLLQNCLANISKGDNKG